MTPICNIDDLRRLAKRRCPRVIFDYIESGSYDEITLAANRERLARLQFRQRVLIDTVGRSMETEILGETLALPFAIAPTGLSGLMWGDGEVHAARAAAAEGIRYTLSTMSILTIEDVREAVQAPFWFQLYVFRDRGFSEEVMERAAAARCPVLFVTVDLPHRGQRHCDIRNGLTVPPRFNLRNGIDVALRPGWAWRVLTARRRTFGNIEAYLKRTQSILGTANWSARHFDQSLDWDDIDWIRKRWSGKLVLKGILDVDDARKAAAAGVDGIVVSNHGGRQLDGAPATIDALPKIAEAVGDRIEVLFDGGIRSGQDVMKALARGARGCMIGRAHLYGLAAMGEAGVRKAIDILRQEMEITMMLTGVKTMRDVNREILVSVD